MNLIFLALLLSAIFLCIKYPERISYAAKGAFTRCTDIMIPSMFIFMCLSCIASSSGIIRRAVYPFKFIYRKIFNLDSNGFAIFLLSFISGYPAGIKLIYDALDKKTITKDYADRLSCFCFSSGPAFIYGISSVILPDSSAGLLLFLSVTSGNIITAIISGMRNSVPEPSGAPVRIDKSAGCIVNSVSGAASAILKMCTMIIFFSGITEILKVSGISGCISKMISALTGTEITSVTSYLDTFLEISSIASITVTDYSAIPMTAALFSFGGICVLLQLISISDGRLPVKRFILSRIMSAVFSWISCSILMRIFNFGICIETFTYKFTADRQFSPVPSVFLIIMSLMLISARKGSSDIKK